MKLRPLFAVVPAVILLKLTACSSDNGNNPSDPIIEAGPGSDAPITTGDGGDGGPPLGPRGSCTVTKAGTAGTLLKGRLLLPEAPADGELLIDGTGNIACAAASCAATPAYATDADYQAAYAAATVVTCTNAVISPALINSHDHITYANTAPKSHGAERFESRQDWRLSKEGHTGINPPGKATDPVILAQELRFLATGVTSIAGSGSASGLARNVDKVYDLEKGVRMKAADYQTFPLGDQGGAGFPTTDPGPDATYASTCALFTSAKRDTVAGIAADDSYLPHIAEGINDYAHREFVCQSEPTDTTYNLMQKQTALIHGIGVSAPDVAKLHPSRSALIWSPRSNIDLYGNTAPVVLYDNLGVPISLGTDWLPSGSMNMARELKCADDLNTTYFGKHFTDRQLWQMVTVNAAFAVGAQSVLGELKAGYAADIAIFSTGAGADYRAVINSSPEDVIATIRGGQPLYGDKDLLGAKGLNSDACEDLTVCGVAKKACVKQDVPTTDLAAITAAGTAVYPLFSCRGETPKDEPSCVPTRGPTAAFPEASAYTGSPDGTDKDGDGIADATDNCPTVFNPIRPMDNGKQADTDGDGIGDACDKCPNDAGETCTAPSSDDIDDDGVPNWKDNCPELSNADQADQDHDGKGDLCDLSCETSPNPGQLLCAQTYDIPTLRNPAATGHPASGTVRAKITGVTVTGLRVANTTATPLVATDFGFFVQSSLAPWSGLYVQTGTVAPTVKVGNIVDVEGDYQELFDVTTLVNPKITVTDSGTTATFAPYAATNTAEISNVYKGPDGPLGEQYESMLCMVGMVAVERVNPDAPKNDYDEFTVLDASTVDLRVDDYLYPPLDNMFAMGTKFTSIAGVCSWSFLERKIYPRSAADLVSP